MSNALVWIEGAKSVLTWGRDAEVGGLIKKLDTIS